MIFPNRTRFFRGLPGHFLAETPILEPQCLSELLMGSVSHIQIHFRCVTACYLDIHPSFTVHMWIVGTSFPRYSQHIHGK